MDMFVHGLVPHFIGAPSGGPLQVTIQKRIQSADTIIAQPCPDSERFVWCMGL
ncbi:hypothetical protein GbCGDNIH7_7049 [Granulibacter bethesdensis]|nr:hypothetical protein GbCGDNIH4_7049 [Granulibacter bethesdensis CGDNIH4]APH60464.1 hypothetical protein GbCGDNIH7_7049 [Granulibacter bethesdensis]